MNIPFHTVYYYKRIAKETKKLMDEQKPLENKQGEPGEKQKNQNIHLCRRRSKTRTAVEKCRKDLLRMAGLGVVFGVCACISFLRSNHGLIRSFPEIHKR